MASDEIKAKLRAFALPEPPQDHVTVDRRAMNEIRDTANKIYARTRYPNANLIFLQALKEWMEQKGAKANFSVLME